MTYYIVQTAPRGEHIVCREKPKHLYSRKPIYICGEQ